MDFRAAAVVAMIFLAACQTKTAEAPPPVGDASITAAVQAKLSAQFGPLQRREERQFERGATDETISFIDVAVSNGTVTLTGEVGGNKAKAKAEELAKQVPGVVAVANQLAVAPRYSDDAGAKSAAGTKKN
jgi:hypothetical protein